MATDKMVRDFDSDLQLLTKELDRSLQGLILCMIFQKRPALDAESWILCVCADSLDDLSERGAISYLVQKLESVCAPATSTRIERVHALKAYDPATIRLLQDIESVADAKLLIGRTVFGRVIGRARIFQVRKSLQTKLTHHTVTA